MLGWLEMCGYWANSSRISATGQFGDAVVITDQ